MTETEQEPETPSKYEPPYARYYCEECNSNAFDIAPYELIICPDCGYGGDNMEFLGYQD